MGEPVRRVSHKAARPPLGYVQPDLFASDVLLIADPALDARSNGRDAGNGSAASEPLDMESVVRRLIAMLSEQQS